MSFATPAPIEKFTLPHPRGEGVLTISVSQPQSARGREVPIPVFILLDADAEFCLAAEIARLKGIGGFHPAPIVVGVGYEADYFSLARLRTADYSLPLTDVGRAALGKLTTVTGEDSGGAEGLLQFLVEVLNPELSRRYPEASMTDRALFGHSLGGLFVAYALLTRPDAFATFAAVSPSLWWNGFAITAELPRLTERLIATERYPRVFVAVGAKEQDPPTHTLPGVDMSLEELQAVQVMARMVDAAEEFAAALRATGLPDVHHVAFADEDHGSVLPAALQRAMSLAMPTPL